MMLSWGLLMATCLPILPCSFKVMAHPDATRSVTETMETNAQAVSNYSIPAHVIASRTSFWLNESKKLFSAGDFAPYPCHSYRCIASF